MAALEEVRRLHVDRPPGHLAAASGIARAGDRLYVVADDELHLGVFTADDHRSPGEMVRLLEGELPREAVARKAAKADLEALCVLPGPLLLALGSGSTERRERGAVWALAADGGLVGAAREIDLGPLYAALRPRFGAFNVEGAAAAGDALVLAHRGDAHGRGNALVVLDLDPAVAALRRGGTLEPAHVRDVRPVELEALGGVGLALSDVAWVDGRLLFSAVAEDTPNPYDDGPFVGAVLGEVGLDGRVLGLSQVRPAVKVEGLEEGGAGGVLVVTDDDDRSTPARLLRCSRP